MLTTNAFNKTLFFIIMSSADIVLKWAFEKVFTGSTKITKLTQSCLKATILLLAGLEVSIAGSLHAAKERKQKKAIFFLFQKTYKLVHPHYKVSFLGIPGCYRPNYFGVLGWTSLYRRNETPRIRPNTHTIKNDLRPFFITWVFLRGVFFKTPRKNTPDFKVYGLLFSHFMMLVMMMLVSCGC